ncbi:hypothetical protein VP01_1770g2 [Puccinia sorghi]|uniref:Uncharacterized protein n=1 Tax=Puccinia sorghi TaxID=27349 RepID=A0A0L6VER1_9BASI|nr:hypothetical protein VP01_1770g2 [Puccinia sorghi]
MQSESVQQRLPITIKIIFRKTILAFFKNQKRVPHITTTLWRHWSVKLAKKKLTDKKLQLTHFENSRIPELYFLFSLLWRRYSSRCPIHSCIVWDAKVLTDLILPFLLEGLLQKKTELVVGSVLQTGSNYPPSNFEELAASFKWALDFSSSRILIPGKVWFPSNPGLATSFKIILSELIVTNSIFSRVDVRIPDSFSAHISHQLNLDQYKPFSYILSIKNLMLFSVSSIINNDVSINSIINLFPLLSYNAPPIFYLIWLISRRNESSSLSIFFQDTYLLLGPISGPQHCKKTGSTACNILAHSAVCTVTVHQSLVESLLEKGGSNNRRFLGVSACQLQEATELNQFMSPHLPLQKKLDQLHAVEMQHAPAKLPFKLQMFAYVEFLAQSLCSLHSDCASKLASWDFLHVNCRQLSKLFLQLDQLFHWDELSFSCSFDNSSLMQHVLAGSCQTVKEIMVYCGGLIKFGWNSHCLDGFIFSREVFILLICSLTVRKPVEIIQFDGIFQGYHSTEFYIKTGLFRKKSWRSSNETGRKLSECFAEQAIIVTTSEMIQFGRFFDKMGDFICPSIYKPRCKGDKLMKILKKLRKIH